MPNLSLEYQGSGCSIICMHCCLHLLLILEDNIYPLSVPKKASWKFIYQDLEFDMFGFS